ncbi:uncharacterized protein TNCV_5075191 [Trichonephila clavipes]|uniref:Uncharacterized protein n=1 Tax=Trichonephila clavipes TaxID=2585209 RepID=A0A8X6RVM6_TRICX|nr:uncharacterized protein TNCV_5075191 [Trichonephila clavipes]
MENVAEFLENIDNNLTYYEIPTQLACAYLKGHLTVRALDWLEVLGYRVVEDKATDYAHLKQALTEQFPVISTRKGFLIEGSGVRVGNSEIQTKARIIVSLTGIGRKIGGRREVTSYSDNSRPQREFNRFESQGVADNRRFDGRRRGGQSYHRFHNQGGRQGGSRNGAFRGQNDQNR